MSYAQYLADNGGMASCGNGLGVMVTPWKNVKHVPSGWVFIPLERATAKNVQEALDLARGGRKHWPEKVDYGAKNDSKLQSRKRKKQR